jgi:hypothetical protein
LRFASGRGKKKRDDLHQDRLLIRRSAPPTPGWKA